MPSWIPWISSSPKPEPPPPPPPPPKKSANKSALNDSFDLTYLQNEAAALRRSLYVNISTLPPYLLISLGFVVGGVTTLGGRQVYARYLRRIPNAEWVTPEMVKRKRWIKGYVTSVGDADDFRLYHTPGIGWKSPFKVRRIPNTRRTLKGKTIHIRMAGIDAPEISHFGRVAQPFSEDSMSWLTNKVEGKFVYCQILKRDQYGRIVAMPYIKWRFLPHWLTGKCLSLEMVREGWACVYEQGGAVYGSIGVNEFKLLQTEAQEARRGIWQHGTDGESPAEYKRRHREAAASGKAVAPPPASDAEEMDDDNLSTEDTGGWLSRLWRGRNR